MEVHLTSNKYGEEVHLTNTGLVAQLRNLKQFWLCSQTIDTFDQQIILVAFQENGSVILLRILNLFGIILVRVEFDCVVVCFIKLSNTSSLVESVISPSK